MPIVSVIVPTCNRAMLVKQAIESILASCNEVFQAEIILIDQSTTSQTRELTQEFPITYLRGSAKGASVARNIGLKAATGTYITFLDDDDTWPANNLLRQIQFLEENPQFGAVCSQVVLTDEQGNITSPPYPDPPFSSGWMFNAFLHYIPQVGSLLVRREIATQVGDFDPTLQGGQDWDWALRLAQLCPIGFIPEVVLRWRMHSSTWVDTIGNRQMEDITWQRYTDVMDVAHRHLPKGSRMNWLSRQRILLKHKGHYIPLFTRYGLAYARQGKLSSATICYWRALRISPLHMVSFAVKTVVRQLQSLARSRAKR